MENVGGGGGVGPKRVGVEGGMGDMEGKVGKLEY